MLIKSNFEQAYNELMDAIKKREEDRKAALSYLRLALEHLDTNEPTHLIIAAIKSAKFALENE